ncbi:hypothetical protein ABB37_04329 [Leptomonas pyrrhocoris]|uniref:Uncharacterized protein n=1 Tax=Leptomonas pyrrhocoris TaxID=157538 RepID=A0A0N0DW21_LEPPY|nr:hypothetical protein ABB37_04329 [Leptomonas pyrrhocoris]KPA80931.1 hypothetical protein ABB37_04329 [Leptomonas pyrrhocoris]|eukprot:XP_015659370.1 hypothetical protein ABB37_04329 [Leptomonas pyrrhocoris]
MRSFLRPASRGVLASTASATCVVASFRTVFVRESWTPVTLQSPDAAEAPFPARLLWQFRSSTPRHLTLCVRAPAPRPVALNAGSRFEDLDASDSAPKAAGSETDEAAAAPRRPEDFVYGRLFLRPYDVAQLLTVLQGWSDAPAVVERPRSTLRLSAVQPSKKGKGTSSSSKPRAVRLTARLTRKLLPQKPENGRVGGAGAPVTPSTDLDPEASEDYPGSVYADKEMGILTAVLCDEDLVLLTAHLESALSDLFAMEHRTIRDAARRAVDRQGVSRPTRYAAQQGEVTSRFAATARRADARDSRLQFGSHVYRSNQQATAAGAQGAAAVSGAHSTSTTAAVPHATRDNFSSGVENVAAQAETKAGAAQSRAATAAAPQADAAAAENDEYEEVVEEVEEAEGEEEAQEAPDTAPDPNQADSNREGGSASESPIPPEEAEGDVALDADLDLSEPATPSTSYRVTHTTDRGNMTVETDSRYATARFVRDGGVTAAEVQEVRRIGDFDVLHRTQQAEGSMEKDGAHTTVRATNTTGAFRSTAGEVKGTFAYQRVSTATATSSAIAAAAAAAAAAIPIEGAAASKVGDGDVAEDDIAAPTMEVKATEVKDAEGEELDEEKAAGKDGGAAAEKPKRTRAAKKSGGGKKKGGRKKTKKASQRKSTSKAAASEPAAQTMAF